MAKKKKVVEIGEQYIPPSEKWFLFIGEKYYKRLQPTPYKKSKLPEYLKKYARQSSQVHTGKRGVISS